MIYVTDQGAGGGRLLIAGTPEDVAACEGSHTGRCLRTLLAIR
jgi:excinuclease ABC subunit A